MSTTGPQPPQRVPTLTEVVAWPEGAPSGAPAAPQPAPPQERSPEADLAAMPAAGTTAAALWEERLVEGVLADVQRQIDLMLEYRIREALTPLLTRVADSVIRDARSELASTLRDVVARAVAHEISRHRTS